MADNNKKKYIKYEDTTYILEDSRIPDPSSADNGKVLGIVNGAYVLKQEQGGGGEGTVKSVNNIEPDANGDVALGASDVHALPDSTVIPAAVTEQTVAGWGFTKNTGTYSKPSGGIPASDLAQAVQDKLDESGLPGVTESDIGKVLAVDSNGEWAAENPVIVSGTDAQVTDAVNDWLDENGLLVATIIDGDTLFVDNMAVIANYDEEEF